MHKSKPVFGVETSTRNVRWSYIITCLVTSITATYTTAMNKITATKALTDYPIHIEHGHVGRAYPPGVILLKIASSNQVHRPVTYTRTYWNIGGTTRKWTENLSTSIPTWRSVCAGLESTHAHKDTRTRWGARKSIMLTFAKNCFIRT
jgi:hypothetical protein